MRRLCCAFLAGLALAGCGGAPWREHGRIINGRAATSAEFPGVVTFVASFATHKEDCTGTFLSSTTLLTAAHCVQPVQSPAGITVPSLGATSLALVANPRWDPTADFAAEIPYDSALVLFPAGTAPGTLAVADRPPRLGAAETIVGYGDTDDHTGVGWGQLRAGTNVVAALAPGIIETEGPASSGGVDQRSVSAPGDSGGPMLVDGAVVGTCSGNVRDLPGARFVDGYMNLFNSAARRFFAAARAAGYDAPDTTAWPPPAAVDGTLVDDGR